LNVALVDKAILVMEVKKCQYVVESQWIKKDLILLVIQTIGKNNLTLTVNGENAVGEDMRGSASHHA